MDKSPLVPAVVAVVVMSVSAVNMLSAQQVVIKAAATVAFNAKKPGFGLAKVAFYPVFKKTVGVAADFVYDDSQRTLSIVAGTQQWTLSYDDVQAVTCDDITAHRYPGWSALYLVGAVPGLIGAAADKSAGVKHGPRHVWCFVELSNPASNIIAMQLAKDSADSIIERTAQLFGDRFAIKGDVGMKIADDAIQVREQRYDVKRSKTAVPVPEVGAKALIVIARPERAPGRVNVFANGELVAVLPPQSYTYVQLEPGDYLVAARVRRNDFSGLRMKLDAAARYYLLVETLSSPFAVRPSNETHLSIHSGWLVRDIVSSLQYAELRVSR